MLTSDFDFELPAELIAQQALPRGQSRLYHLPRETASTHLAIADLPDLLGPGDLMVVNDTEVIPARLFARRSDTGGRIEILLVDKLGATEWDCLLKPGRRARPGTVLDLSADLSAEVREIGPDGRRTLSFSAAVEPFLDELGHVPLPPYIKRPDDATDHERYQTVFAATPGAIAAPTAGLHFDETLLERLETHGVEIARLTLHVGIGTFKPVTAELVHEHAMDEERYEISQNVEAAVSRVRGAGGRIVAVGTTVTRALEAAARGSGSVVAGASRTDLFIIPGYPFRVVDVLLTNFHLPRSSLLMLVSAFAGRERILSAYGDAIRAGYRFYSYGDAMLIERASPSR